MSFGAPLFLLAVLAGIIPVLLHMINRQRAPVLTFSTLRFLRLSVQRTRRRKYLNDLLLMLLRIAALVLIALGLSKPAIRGLHAMLRGASTAVVIILDNSASMGMSIKDTSRWEQAVDAAYRVLDELSEGDTVALLLPCGPASPQLGRLYANHEIVREAIGNAELSYQRADLGAQLEHAKKLLAKAEKPNKEIYVITDMQEVSWQALTKQKGGQSAGDKDIPIVLVDVFGAAVPNTALRSVQLHSVVPTAGVPMQATADVYGAAAIEQQRHAELYIDGAKQSVSPALTVPPAGEVKHTFQFAIGKPGVHRGEIRLVGQDALRLDDRAYFAITVEQQIPVAVVKAEAQEIPYLEDTFYLERALMPGLEGNWPIRVRTLLTSALVGEPLEEYAAIYCVNLPQPEPAAVAKLLQYVRGGGHLLWIAGENVDPQAYNDANKLAGGDLLPAPLGADRQPPEDKPDGWRVGLIDGTYRPLSQLTDPPSLYQSVLVYKHVQVSEPEKHGARVLARLDDGEPILIERSVGAGSVLWLGTSAHIDWTNLPLRPIFLPLVAQLTFHFAGAGAQQHQLLAGSPIVLPIEPQLRPKEIEVIDPAGRQKRLRAEESQQSLRFTDTYRIGIYRVRLLGGPQVKEYGFAVNIDPSECNAARIDPKELEPYLAPHSAVVCNEPDKLAATIQRVREGESLWDLFVIAVLVALLLECFVANRAGMVLTGEQAAPRRPPRRPATTVGAEEPIVFVSPEKK